MSLAGADFGPTDPGTRLGLIGTAPGGHKGPAQAARRRNPESPAEPNGSLQALPDKPWLQPASCLSYNTDFCARTIASVPL